jgi:hypothetical protein
LIHLLPCHLACRKNTADKTYKLLDLEKWAAIQLLNFDLNSPTFDINDVVKPRAGDLRLATPTTRELMAVCYKDLGPVAPIG